MELVITTKLKLLVSNEEKQALLDTFHAVKSAENDASLAVFEAGKPISATALHALMYYELRSKYGIASQTSCSICRIVAGSYAAAKSNNHDFTKIVYKRGKLIYQRNRDYSFVGDKLSISTLNGRVKLAYQAKAFEKYFDGTWSFGAAELIYKKGKFFLCVTASKEIDDVQNFSNVVGVDFGINFLMTAYDSDGTTTFLNGRHIKDKRAKYKRLRKNLQKRSTPSARKRIKAIGNRENRFVRDVMHVATKALVSKYGKDTLFVIEDLTGVRSATEKVHIKDRYVSVSWPFYQNRIILEYKALLASSKVIAVSPKYTSQKCPICGHIKKNNRDKKKHRFKCKTCGYTSNDDRIGAMNLHQMGIEYLKAVAA